MKINFKCYFLFGEGRNSAEIWAKILQLALLSTFPVYLMPSSNPIRCLIS